MEYSNLLRTKDLKYFSLCALNLFNTRVSQFELNYWNKLTLPRHSNLLRCTCINLSQGEESHDKDCWINAPEGKEVQKGEKGHVGFPVPWVLSSFYPGVVSPCCAVLQWGWSVTCCWLWERWEGELMWQGLRGLCSCHVMSCSWDRSTCDEDGQVFLACFQVMKLRDARHTPPPLLSVVLLVTWDMGEK